MKKHQIRKYFSVFALSAELGFSKPDKLIFEYALCKANCLPENAFMIGDRLDSEDRTKYLILLEDVSDRFAVANKADLLDKNVWFSAAESLAIFHAAFWNLKEIDSAKLPVENIETVHSYIDGTYKDFEKFKNYVGDRFDRATYVKYENAVNINVSIINETYKRKINNSKITLVHGDSHIYNFMNRTRCTGLIHGKSAGTIIKDKWLPCC